MTVAIDGHTKPQPKELLKALPELYKRAAKAGKNLTNYIEQSVDPSSEWSGDDKKLGGFGRIMAASGVIWRSDPGQGYFAHDFNELVDDPQRVALIPEWANRVFRAARYSGYMPQISPAVSQGRFVINQDDETLGSVMRPYADAAGAYQQNLSPTLPLAEVVAMTTPVEGNSYRRAYMEQPAAGEVRWSRVAEAADIPRATVKTSERAVRLFKYGRAIELSYEALRNTPIDKVGFFIAQAALTIEADRVAQAVDVLINGDGNAGTSAMAYNHSALDTGTTLTYKGWLAFKAKFRAPYVMTHVFHREAEGVNLMFLNVGTPNPFLAQVGAFVPVGSVQRITDAFNGVVRSGDTDAVPAGSYLGLDRRFALERLTEIGSDIQETVNFIERQTRLLTFTETDGFAILDPNANKVMALA